MKINDRVFHIISNTHWDREWRFPFQINRQMLVNMIDQVIHILENEPKYKAFHLDSQSIVIEDYLEIKPHNKEKISNLVREKKLFIGPWYVLPDEFQVGGENLIRNLLIGHKICNEIGRVSKVGYSPFSWGQISQLPQIYTNFGIDFVMFYRGVNSIDSPKAEFIWEGADGTQVLASRFSTMPRYNFYFYIYRPVLFNEFVADWKFDWNRESLLFHFADLILYKTDYFNPKPADTYFEQNIKPQVEKIINDQANDFTTPHVIWMEGHDSSGPHIGTIKIIEDIKKYFPHLNVIHSTLEDYSEAVKKSIDFQKLKLVKGERRSTQFDRRSGNLFGYTTSARMDLKVKNFDCERWLQFYAEPFYNFASLMGLDTNDKSLELAWKLLVQNSAHDSIGGCSLDEVHQDMICRFKQVKEISTSIYSKALQFILANGKLLEKENEYENYLTVFNTTSYVRDEIVPVVIDIPIELAAKNLELIDFQGKKFDLQISKSENVQPVLEQMINRPMYVDVKRFFAYAHLQDIPPFGYKTFKVIPSTKKINTTPLASIKNGKIILENEHLKITINKNGTFDILDKSTKAKFQQLAYFYDEGESGHAWVHQSVKPIVTTLNSKPKIKILENGNLYSKILISYKFKIPERKMKIYSGREVVVKSNIIPIDLSLIFTKKSRRVDLEIRINNTVENHRLRVMFPSNIQTDYHFGEGQFDVVKRPIKRIDAKDWIEQPMYDFPLHNFVSLSDNQKGISILVDGLKEYEVFEDKKHTIAITLIRGFSYVIIPSSTEEFLEMKGSQCLGEHKFRISVYTHKGNWEEGLVFPEALKFNQPLSIVETNRLTENFVSPKSFLQILPENLIFSCFKKSEDNSAYILRIYNPTEKLLESKLIFDWKLKEAELVTMEEKIISPINFATDTIELKIEPKKIVTLKLKFFV
ncbi:MAG: glycosyl hydrolase-related protein [Ignavibacteria bacterium]|nr:glycosyl hydrolase-related protein [Ignavibacteria bacterium]